MLGFGISGIYPIIKPNEIEEKKNLKESRRKNLREVKKIEGKTEEKNNGILFGNLFISFQHE